jgi:hypothetical protein
MISAWRQFGIVLMMKPDFCDDTTTAIAMIITNSRRFAIYNILPMPSQCSSYTHGLGFLPLPNTKFSNPRGMARLTSAV